MSLFIASFIYLFNIANSSKTIIFGAKKTFKGAFFGDEFFATGLQM